MADTREYPSVVEVPADPVPWWAVVLMTLAVLVNLACWPLAAAAIWEHWH